MVIAGGLPVVWLLAASTAVVAPVEASVPRVPGPYVALRIDLYDGPMSAGESPTPVGEQRGSGVVVGRAGGGEWLVLTNAHVVDPGDEATRAMPRVYAGGKWRAGRVIASNAESDLAVVRMRFAEPMRSATVSPDPPTDRAAVETHGFAAGRKYTERESQLRRDLPLGGGSTARAARRYFVRTTFTPGESGGAVTIDDRLVALIHGNDRQAGWGICVDQPSIAEFLEPFLETPQRDK